MKKLLLGACAFAFLALIGAQASHAHAGAALDSCGLCAVGSSTVRHAPAAAPAPVLIPIRTPVAAEAESSTPLLVPADAKARSPPRA